MGKDKKRKKLPWQQYLGGGFFVLIGAVCGFMLGKHMSAISKREGSLGEFLFLIAFWLVSMYTAMFLQIIIHEAGHLLFGLLTGYRYSSFRVGSYMWVKEGNQLKFKKLTIAGTGGQCLMIPPEMSDGKFSFVLYNLGGSLINTVSSLFSIGLYLIFKDVSYLSEFLLIFSMIGIGFALMNGIPMRLGTVDNDGYNALSLAKDKEALRSFWLQLKINEQLAKGIRLKDMPQEWFVVPMSSDMKKKMTAIIGILACNRLMDTHSFEEGIQLMDQLLEMENIFTGLHRKLLISDRIYLELISDKKQEIIDTLLDNQQRKFMKSMRKFPSILRTNYAYELLIKQDTEQAAKIKDQFEKCARTYPYSSDIESERELISIADSVAVQYMEGKVRA